MLVKVFAIVIIAELYANISKQSLGAVVKQVPSPVMHEAHGEHFLRKEHSSGTLKIFVSVTQ